MEHDNIFHQLVRRLVEISWRTIQCFSCYVWNLPVSMAYIKEKIWQVYGISDCKISLITQILMGTMLWCSVQLYMWIRSSKWIVLFIAKPVHECIVKGIIITCQEKVVDHLQIKIIISQRRFLKVKIADPFNNVCNCICEGVKSELQCIYMYFVYSQSHAQIYLPRVNNCQKKSCYLNSKKLRLHLLYIDK